MRSAMDLFDFEKSANLKHPSAHHAAVRDISYATQCRERRPKFFGGTYAASHLWGHKLLLLLKGLEKFFELFCNFPAPALHHFSTPFQNEPFLSTETKIQVTVKNISIKMFGEFKIKINKMKQ